MLIVHYDYSGQYHSEAALKSDKPVLSLGGYVSSAGKWDECKSGWKEVLSRTHVSTMHITVSNKLALSGLKS